MENKRETIELAIKAREDEIVNYQLNIDNFKDIINQIETKYEHSNILPDTLEHTIMKSDIEFAEQLKQSIIENEVQKSRVHYILNALRKQL